MSWSILSCVEVKRTIALRAPGHDVIETVEALDTRKLTLPFQASTPSMQSNTLFARAQITFPSCDIHYDSSPQYWFYRTLQGLFSLGRHLRNEDRSEISVSRDIEMDLGDPLLQSRREPNHYAGSFPQALSSATWQHHSPWRLTPRVGWSGLEWEIRGAVEHAEKYSGCGRISVSFSPDS